MSSKRDCLREKKRSKKDLCSAGFSSGVSARYLLENGASTTRPGQTDVEVALEIAQVLGEAALGMPVDRATYQPNAEARKATAPGSGVTVAAARGVGPANPQHIGPFALEAARSPA